MKWITYWNELLSETKIELRVLISGLTILSNNSKLEEKQNYTNNYHTGESLDLTRPNQITSDLLLDLISHLIKISSDQCLYLIRYHQIKLEILARSAITSDLNFFSEDDMLLTTSMYPTNNKSSSISAQKLRRVRNNNFFFFKIDAALENKITKWITLILKSQLSTISTIKNWNYELQVPKN